MKSDFGFENEVDAWPVDHDVGAKGMNLGDGQAVLIFSPFAVSHSDILNANGLRRDAMLVSARRIAVTAAKEP
jgi:hypothetical protein